VCFFVVPQKAFAVDFNFFNFSGEDDYQVLSEFESKKIMQDIPDVLYNQWILSKANGYSNPMETTAVSLVKHISMLNMWNYFFRDLPLDTSVNIIKESVDIVKLIGTEDTSGIIKKIEKGTVDVAVNYLKEYFFKGQIKVSFGAMEMKYKTELREVDNPLQYIIMYKRIDDKRSKVIARIYSPKEIIPPASRGSMGGAKGFYSSLEYGQNISPFIVEINGIMEDGLYGSYFWDEKNTIIKTVFPETVPDFGLKPKTWQEKYIINPIKSTLESFSGIIDFFTDNSGSSELVDYVFKDTTDSDAIDEEIEKMSEGSTLEEDYPIETIEDTPIKIIKESTIENNEDAEKEIKDAEKKVVEEEVDPIVCSKSSQYISSHDIVINEIAWMGGKNSSSDEWIELKNVSSSDINLKGWTLRDEEDQINILFEDYTVPEGGFLLLERTDDDSVPFKKADMIYKGSLSNSEEELYLFDNLCQLKDFASGNPDWPAGDSKSRKTMERDSDLNSWHTYSGTGDNSIWGTPKDDNSDVKQEAIVLPTASTSSFSSSGYSSGTPTPIITYCSQASLVSPNRSKIVINEVAWMGSENNASDEWIELKNISSETIKLEGWQLLDAENIKIVFDASAVINPQGFYLLERTDDGSVPNIQMDKDYTGALSNNDESLRLFDSNCQLMDEALASPDWPAGDNESRKTMERDSDLSGWHTYSSESVDASSQLWGTPKKENSLKLVVEDEEDQSNNEEDPDDEEEVIIDDGNHLLITEVQLGENGSAEYVEIYNQTENPISMCPDETNCFYLSYYSQLSEWYAPYRNWKFPIGTIIEPNDYYIIDIFNPAVENSADWRVKSNEDEYYKIGQIGNSAGSLSLFSNNPEYIKVETEERLDNEKTAASIALKVDTLSWKKDSEETPIVKEGNPFIILESNKVIARKWSNGKYRDTDNNANDFQLEAPSLRNHAPKPPEKIQDLTVAINEEQKNSVILSWTAPFDEDTIFEKLNYEIYYSRNSQIDDNSLVDIKEYTGITIVSEENNKRSVIIKDLFYDSEYYFKVVAKDPEKNISPLSEDVSFKIEKANHQKRAPLFDFKRSGYSQFEGPVGSSVDSKVLIEGDQNFTFNNDFTSTSVIDENGTIYFAGINNGSKDFYAYSQSQKKWSIHCYSETCGFYPSLGNDGTIYLSSEHSIYALSPSGKMTWKKDYTRVFTKSIIIDSEEKIYFLASKETMGPILISIDKNGLETNLYDTQEILKGASPSFTELVIDDSNNIYFAVNDFVVKYNNGTIVTKQFFPKYENTYSGPINMIATINRLSVSFNGTVLLSLSNGKYVTVAEVSSVLYAVDNNLSQILWFKDGYSGPISFNDKEFYYLRVVVGSYVIRYLGAADILTGKMKWERTVGNVNFVVSDPLNRIYFINPNGVSGYDSDNMPESLDNRLFHASPGSNYGIVASIGDKKMFFSDTQRVYEVDMP
jgi:hypothetical protein